MTYKMSWMQSNYVEPIKRLAYYFEQQRQAAAGRAMYNSLNTPSNICVNS